MPYLIIPSRRTRQPRGAARVNWASPLAKDLRFLWNGANGGADSVSGTPSLRSGTVSTSFSAAGVGVECAANSYVYHPDSDSLDVVGDVTILTVVVPYLTYDDASIINKASGAGANASPFLFGIGGDVPMLGRANSGYRVWRASNTGVLTAGRQYCLAATAPAAIETAPRFWVNGAAMTDTPVNMYGGGGSGAATSNSNPLQIGNRPDLLADYLGGVYLCAVWARTLSDYELVSLSANPWQIFTPDPRRLYFDGGASGGGGDTSLISSDSTQTQTTDAAILVTSSFLVVQEATQNHSSENVVLDASVSTNLIVADATQTHTSENSALQVSTNLGIDDSTQSQTSNNIALTSVHSLIIQECIQDQNSENIALDSGLILTVADCIQGQTAENITILASSLLLINDATQDQTSENLSFTLATNISINDSVHSISSESPNLTIPGSGTGATVEEIVDGIMAALLAETIPVNIKKINDVLVYGIGTDGNPWRESA